MTDSQRSLLIIFVLIPAIVFGPFLTIWALNTLFPVLMIDYTIKTWFATIVVGSIFTCTSK